MNEIFSFHRGDILELNMGDIDYFIEGFEGKSTIERLIFNEGNYILNSYQVNNLNFTKMRNNIQIHQSKINKANLVKYKFRRFLNIITQKSHFVVLKDALKNSLFDYIQAEALKDFNKLSSSIFKGVSEIYEKGLLPNIALYFYYNYDRIFSTLMTVIFPFDKERISFDFPTVNSRTDFGLKVFYRFNASEIISVQKAIKLYNVSWDEPHVARFLFINCIKTITKILDELFTLYYRKLNISSPVQSIVNVQGSSQKSTKLYDEVTYYIALREW
jgi:hypothetical protein